MIGTSLDFAHLLAGSMVLVSFMLLYQDRMFGLLNIFAVHAMVLSASGIAPNLFVIAQAGYANLSDLSLRFLLPSWGRSRR